MKKVFGISGWSGSGKTTLMKKLIKLFSSQYKLKVCAIKHAHENFEIDHKGKDTYNFAKSGAKKVIVSSSKKTAVIEYMKNFNEGIENLLKYVGSYDIVLIEGWKNGNFNKIEVFRESVNKPILYKNDRNFVAIATDNPDLKLERDVVLLNLNNTKQVADFIIKYN